MPVTSIADFASLPERVRAFIALRLDAAVDDAIAALIERLRAPQNDTPRDDLRHEGIRWIRRANFHLTLLFLGPSVPRERLAPIADALATIAETTAPFEIAARGVGVFPTPARPRVISVGLDSVGFEGGGLADLAARVTEAAARCGFAPERRAYSPHLTIGRVRSLPAPVWLRQRLGEAADSRFGVSRIERVILYRSELGRSELGRSELGRSELGPQSSTYHELAAFPLGAREGG